jgi:predicted SnoaL-like aldol condensation-catalyzing enzyme
MTVGLRIWHPVTGGKQPEQAVKKYLGPQYVQHNPQAPDGADAFIGFVPGFAGQFPELSIDQACGRRGRHRRYWVHPAVEMRSPGAG